ncbi:MAG: hypothetical protein ACM3JB_04445 [Acidobacteriaceae bacterium]
MLCPACQTPNSDTNCFCGHCGQPLPSKPLASNYPPGGFDEPEINQIDPRIPANEYSPPRESFTVEPASRESVETRFARAYKASDAKPPEPIEPVSAPPSGNSTSIFGLDTAAPPKFETDPHAVKPISASMFDFESDSERASRSLHGPSFLGLNTEPDFLDDEVEPSHRRRNWLLIALAIVIVIAAVQWRNIRDTGLQYAGTVHFKLPLKRGDGQAQVAQQTPATSENGDSAASPDGKPEMEVNPTQNAAVSPGGNTAETSQPGTPIFDANAAQFKGQEPNGATPATSSSASEAQSKAADTNTTETGAAKSGANKNKEVASGKHANKPAAQADDDSGSEDQTEVAEAKPPKTKPSRTTRSKSSAGGDEAPKPVPGADDIARAYASSDPATAANWLWAATKKGNKEAPVLLADYYAKGKGVPKDCEQATILLRSSAQAGNPHARARLGMYYATGQCVHQDRAEAWRWLSLAHTADPGSDWVEQYRRRLWTQMTPQERARSGGGPSASE